MQHLFAVTLFVSASLLLVIQPMFAKMVLPKLGGAPAVWNTCMVFYQAALLAGYLYAHATLGWLGARRQAALHLVVMAAAWLALPIAVRSGMTAPAEAHPTLWLLALLGVSVGLPFFVISTSAPTLQAWFARTGHPSARDPYFLYAASNLGSMLALLAYPLVLEPQWRLAQQATFWTIGYGLLTVLVVACAVALWRSRNADGGPTVAFRSAKPAEEGEGIDASPAPGVRQRMHWLLLALVPSSLMLGVTTHITLDIAAVPMFWVVPLALYLLSFVLVFARRPIVPHRWILAIQPYLVVALAAVFFLWKSRWVPAAFSLHLAVFFLAAMVCHGELARRRPPARYLTEFYLWMSVGGMLGGMFNAIVAPQVFTWVVEYPLMVAVACAMRPQGEPLKLAPSWRVLAAVSAAGAGVTAVALAFGLDHAFKQIFTPLTQAWSVSPNWERILFGLVLSELCIAALGVQDRPIAFGLGVGVILIASLSYSSTRGELAYRERSFFGVLKVTYSPADDVHTLLHGSTIHGTQSHKPELRHKALSYYHRTGPLGRLLLSRPAKSKEWAVVGMGTCSTAAYGRPGARITYYEIDPAVVRLSRDSGYFTYWRDSKAELQVVLGDARLSLESAADGAYDVLAVDAFTSDAIPLHLLTREAVDLYLRKLAPDGVLAIHISNRYMSLENVVGRLAEEAGVQAWIDNDRVSDKDEKEGKFASTWVCLARVAKALGPLARDRRWKPLSPDPEAPLWTDDFSSLRSVLTW